MCFKNQLLDIKFINRYGILIPNILSKVSSTGLEPPPESTGI